MKTILGNEKGMGTVEVVLIVVAMVVIGLALKSAVGQFVDRSTGVVLGPEESSIFNSEGQIRFGSSSARTNDSSDVSLNDSGGSKHTKKTMGRAGRITPPYKNSPGNRAPDELNKVLNSLNVEQDLRYAKSTKDTYCNIFAWDATLALGAEIPHWVNRETDEPYWYDQALSYSQNAYIAKEMTVNDTVAWMADHASEIGYRETSKEDARLAASRGKPVVAMWKSASGKHGHIVVLRPYDPSLPGDPEGVYIAQAGTNNFDYGALEDGFKGNKINEVVFYVHE